MFSLKRTYLLSSVLKNRDRPSVSWIASYAIKTEKKTTQVCVIEAARADFSHIWRVFICISWHHGEVVVRRMRH